MTVESPCVRNCCLDEQDICAGCFRHIDEIVGWRSMSEGKQQQIVELCQQRAKNFMMKVKRDKG